MTVIEKILCKTKLKGCYTVIEHIRSLMGSGGYIFAKPLEFKLLKKEALKFEIKEALSFVIKKPQQLDIKINPPQILRFKILENEL